MAKIVIFGIQDFAQLAHFYLSRDDEHEVVGFTVHKSFILEDSFMNLPIVPFENLENHFPPHVFKVFAPMSSAKMNSIRESVFKQIKSKGYQCISYISPRAIYYETPIGENCFILEGNIIQPYTEIGDNVIVWSGNHIGHHTKIDSHCFIASHAVISGHVSIGKNCFIGVNATLNNGITVADNTFIGSGALVNANTQKHGVYPGIPAEISIVPSNRLRGV